MNLPAVSEEKLRALVAASPYQVDPRFPVIAVAVRAYFLRTMGNPTKNDVGIYDDAIFLLPKGKGIHRFNANTDPSRIGQNVELGKPFAMLAPGLWYFRQGLHNGKVLAWREPDAEEADTMNLPENESASGRHRPGFFEVIRDPGNGKKYLDVGYHAINIHPGGTYGTSSWGCQTFPPEQYNRWLKASYDETAGQKSSLDVAALRVLPYLLMDGPIN